MKGNITKENVVKILESLYFLVFAVFVAWSFLNSTKFQITWPEYFYTDMRALLLIIIILKAGYLGNYNEKDLLLIAILGSVFLFNYNRNGYDELVHIFLLIIAAKGISLKKIVRVFLCVLSVLLVVTVGAALLGKIENLVYYQEGRRSRMALGIGYPTDFSAYVFYGILCYTYLRGERLKYIETGIIFLLGCAVYWITDARLNTLCILITAAVFTYNKWKNDRAKKCGNIYTMNKAGSMILALSPVLCGAFMVIASVFYSTGSKITEILDRVLNYRLYQGNKAIDIFGFTLWGQQIPMQGYGGTTELPKHYFFLDCSYLNIVMQFGLLVFGCVLLIWILISFQARQEKEWVLLWIVAIICAQCMVEHHMLEIAYNPFLWGVFASKGKDIAALKTGNFRKLRSRIHD